MTEEILERRIDSLEDQVESLQKKLEIATKALKHYADTATWDCCERCQCAYVDGSVAATALKEMEEV
jgi:hypothetical protein